MFNDHLHFFVEAKTICIASLLLSKLIWFISLCIPRIVLTIKKHLIRKFITAESIHERLSWLIIDLTSESFV